MAAVVAAAVTKAAAAAVAAVAATATAAAGAVAAAAAFMPLKASREAAAATSYRLYEGTPSSAVHRPADCAGAPSWRCAAFSPAPRPLARSLPLGSRWRFTVVRHSDGPRLERSGGGGQRGVGGGSSTGDGGEGQRLSRPVAPLRRCGSGPWSGGALVAGAAAPTLAVSARPAPTPTDAVRVKAATRGASNWVPLSCHPLGHVLSTSRPHLGGRARRWQRWWLVRVCLRRPQGWDGAGGGGRATGDRGPPRQRPGTRWCRSATATSALVTCPAAARPRDLQWSRRRQRRPAAQLHPPNQRPRSRPRDQLLQSVVPHVPALPPSLRWPAAPLCSAKPLLPECQAPSSSRTTAPPGRRRRRQRRSHRAPPVSLTPMPCPPALGPLFRSCRCQRRARRPSVAADGTRGGSKGTSPLLSPPRRRHRLNDADEQDGGGVYQGGGAGRAG